MLYGSMFCSALFAGGVHRKFCDINCGRFKLQVAGQCRSVQVSAGQCRSVQVSAGQCRSVQVGAGQCGSVQVGAGQCRSVQVNAG
jgi:hypothetical protein